MLKRRKSIKIARCNEKLSNQIGVPLIVELCERLSLRKKIDNQFGKPGSNRGIKASDSIMTLIYMFIDGALHLEDIQHLINDEHFKSY